MEENLTFYQQTSEGVTEVTPEYMKSKMGDHFGGALATAKRVLKNFWYRKYTVEFRCDDGNKLIFHILPPDYQERLDYYLKVTSSETEA